MTGVAIEAGGQRTETEPQSHRTTEDRRQRTGRQGRPFLTPKGSILAQGNALGYRALCSCSLTGCDTRAIPGLQPGHPADRVPRALPWADFRRLRRQNGRPLSAARGPRPSPRRQHLQPGARQFHPPALRFDRAERRDHAFPRGPRVGGFAGRAPAEARAGTPAPRRTAASGFAPSATARAAVRAGRGPSCARPRSLPCTGPDTSAQAGPDTSRTPRPSRPGSPTPAAAAPTAYSSSADFDGHANGSTSAATTSRNSGITTSGRFRSGRGSGSGSWPSGNPPSAAGSAGVSAVSGVSFAGHASFSPLRSSLPRRRSSSSITAAAVPGRAPGSCPAACR